MVIEDDYLPCDISPNTVQSGMQDITLPKLASILNQRENKEKATKIDMGIGNECKNESANRKIGRLRNL